MNFGGYANCLLSGITYIKHIQCGCQVTTYPALPARIASSQLHLDVQVPLEEIEGCFSPVIFHIAMEITELNGSYSVIF